MVKPWFKANNKSTKTRMLCTIFLRDCRKISPLRTSEFKRLNQHLFPLKSQENLWFRTWLHFFNLQLSTDFEKSCFMFSRKVEKFMEFRYVINLEIVQEILFFKSSREVNNEKILVNFNHLV